MVPPASHRVSRVRRYSGLRRQPARVRVRGSNPVSPAFPGRSAPERVCDCRSPAQQPRRPSGSPVWPGPRSLAATGGISVDFSSSGYLDVSVPRVAPPRAMCSPRGRRGSGPAGFSHSEIRGSCGHVPLTAAYRSLSRPSSASCAKASAARAFHLLSETDCTCCTSRLVDAIA